VNIMMKNAVDVIFAGFCYWLVGYGISHGTSIGGVIGSDLFCLNTGLDLASLEGVTDFDAIVDWFSHYIFQFTFAATATTIVSGAVSGRMKFVAYCMSSFFSTIIYCVAAHWVFNREGWLKKLGAVDFAGDGPVHLLGAVNGAVGTVMLGPRADWLSDANESGAANSIFGLFLLWWGWLGFNCGSTFGITGSKWIVAARVAVTTISSSVGGGLFAVGFSLFQNRKIGVVVHHGCVVNGVLAGLVAVTASCSAVSPAEAVFIGMVGALVSELTNQGLRKFQVLDDPVGALGVHGTSAIWGLVAGGLFIDSSMFGGPKESGLFHGGGFKLLAVNALSCVVIILWTIFASMISFKIIDLTIGLRATAEEERLGFDWSEHNIKKKHREELAKLKSRIKDLQDWKDSSGKLAGDDLKQVLPAVAES